MSDIDPSLIAGLDPAGLFALGTADDEPESGSWEPPDMAEAARLFPQWTVKKLLGRGGMGAVYLMHQPELDREVAVKLLPMEACRDERSVERFRREARTLAKLRHPGIVALHEAGVTPAGHFFFVMEHVDGRPLSEWMADGRLDVPRALEVVRQVCDALAYAHGRGVIHRDIKPSNILIDQNGQAKVADFGLARWEHAGSEDELNLSRTGVFMGTPAYTAPEQARDAAHVDHRADLYSLGVLLYEMLTGELPRGVFQPPSRKVGSDVRLDGVVQRALQERPEDRYQAAAQLKEDVTEAPPAEAPAPAVPTKLRALAAVVAAVLVAGGSWVAFDRRAEPNIQLVARATPAPEHPVPAPPAPPPGEAEVSPPVVPPEPSAVPQAKPVIAAAPAAEPAAPAQEIPPVAPVGERRIRVWSVDPVAPALYPPDALTREAWRDAVLLDGGGVVLRTNGSLAVWRQSSPGRTYDITPVAPVLALAGTPSEAVMLDDRGKAFLLPSGAGEPREIGGGIKRLFASALLGTMLALSDGGRLQVLAFETGVAARSLPALPDSGVRDAVLDADGRVWAATEDGRLWSHPPGNGAEFQLMQGTDIERVAAMGKGVLAISADHRVAGFAGAVVPDNPGKVRRIAAVDGMALAVDEDGRATMWGSLVSDAPQRFRLSQESGQVRLGPTGLIAAW